MNIVTDTPLTNEEVLLLVHLCHLAVHWHHLEQSLQKLLKRVRYFVYVLSERTSERHLTHNELVEPDRERLVQ